MNDNMKLFFYACEMARNYASYEKNLLVEYNCLGKHKITVIGFASMCEKGCFGMALAEQEIREIARNSKWGFLREDQEDADKAGIDTDTGLFRTSLYDYFKGYIPNYQRLDARRHNTRF